MSGGITQEGVDDLHTSVATAVLKILADQNGETVDFGVGPHMSIEPGELVFGSAVNGSPHEISARIENRKLRQETIRLLEGLFCR